MTGKGFTEGVTFYLGRMTGISQAGKEESSPPPQTEGDHIQHKDMRELKDTAGCQEEGTRG